MSYSDRLSRDKYTYVKYLDNVAKNTNPRQFINFVQSETNLINNPILLYLLALRNSDINNSIDPLIFAKQFSYKIPKKVITMSKGFKNQMFYEYLSSNSWLTSLGGF
jgi:hypothetical protein